MTQSSKTRTLFLLDCRCGHRMEVHSGQAGNQVPCADCGEPVQVDSFCELRKKVSICKLHPKDIPIQFRIRHLLMATVVFAFLSGLAVQVGVVEVASIVIFLLSALGFAILMSAMVQFQGAIMQKFWDYFQDDN